MENEPQQNPETENVEQDAGTQAIADTILSLKDENDKLRKIIADKDRNISDLTKVIRTLDLNSNQKNDEKEDDLEELTKKLFD